MYIAILPLLILISTFQTDISEIRLEFSKISDNQDIQAFYQTLQNLNIDDATLNAYKGTSYCMMAKTAFNPFEKLRLFNQGKQLIDQSVSTEPNNIEIRLLRNLINVNRPNS